jgi:hypothetical protein
LNGGYAPFLPGMDQRFDQAADIRKRPGEIPYQLPRFDKDANGIIPFPYALRLTRRGDSSSLRVWRSGSKSGVKSPE